MVLISRLARRIPKYSVIPSRGQGELLSSGLAAFRQVQDHERGPFFPCEYGAG